MSVPDTDERKQFLEQVLRGMLALADELDVPLVAIRISEAIDELIAESAGNNADAVTDFSDVSAANVARFIEIRSGLQLLLQK